VFGRVSVVSVAMNLVAIPAMAVTQLAGLAAVAAAAIAPAAATVCGGVAAVAAQALVGSSALVEDVPWAAHRVPGPGAPLLVAYYAALAAAWRWPRPRGRAAGRAAALALVTVIVVAPAAGVPPAAGRLRLTVLDVGQAEALLVQLPGGHALLVDAAGTPGPFDIGGRVVTPAIWALGTRRLEWLALSHGDRDHAGGAAAIVRDLAPRELWEGVPVPRDPERARLRLLAASRGIPWRTVHAGMRLEAGEVVIDAVHPRPPEWERQRVRNDDSMVLRLRYRDVEFWLTGDAGAEFERRHVFDEGGAPVRVLKVGHHGSRTSTSDALVAGVRPQIAVISAGRHNLFGHPAPDVLRRLEAAGAAVFRTDRDGAIAIETDGAMVLVRTARGRMLSYGVSRRGA
jgi:competence protein ComEC